MDDSIRGRVSAWRRLAAQRTLLLGSAGIAAVALLIQTSVWAFDPNSLPSSPPAPPPGEEIGIETLGTRSEDSLSSRGGTRPSDAAQGAADAPRGSAVGAEPDRSRYRLDGRTPLPGLNSILGKPGQMPLQAPIVSAAGSRNPSLYADVIDQFGVEGNPRYAVDAYTYCNTFAGDVARAMGVPFPTKAELLGIRGDRATVGAADLNRWFIAKSAAEGWWEVDPNTPEELKKLKDHVNAGKPAFGADPGHVVVIRPGQEVESVGDLHIAQAGKWNLNDVPLDKITEDGGFKPRFFLHE